MTDNFDVAAVIATRNRVDPLQRCLAALAGQTVHPTAVYVIDNASTDGTAEFLTNVGSGIQYRYSAHNTGSAGGFNALDQLLLCATRSSDILAAAPKKLTPEGRLWCAEMIYDRKRRVARAPSRELYERNEPFECDWTANTGLLLRREAIALGGFPLADLFAFGEDTEYCLRLRRHGRLIISPCAVVVHRDPSLAWPVPVSLLWRKYYVQRNTIYLSSRRLVMPARGVLLVLLSMIREAVVILRKLNAKRVRLRTLIAATYHGLIGRLGPAPSWLARP
jgi:rhamnopyranosyl-N-acetylglucosaminyl-diphospho-decaprenol beta-1,3/1,4-galactofuranosyltransferase